jgi:hypothetical protein
VALKITDIDSKRMLLRVEQGKGARTRCSPRLLEALRIRSAPPVRSTGCFPPAHGPASHQRLQTACRDACLRSRLAKRITVRTPGTVCHHPLENGTDIRVIQVLLATVNTTTAHYTRVSPQSPATLSLPDRLDRIGHRCGRHARLIGVHQDPRNRPARKTNPTRAEIPVLYGRSGGYLKMQPLLPHSQQL